MKILGPIILIAVLVISGVLYFKNDTIQMQQARPAQAEDENLKAEMEASLDVTSDEPIQAPSEEVSIQSIPGIQGASRQIIAVQQQIESRMISCVQNAQRTQGAILSLRRQENALEARRDALNDRISQTDSSTPAGRERRDRLRREQEALDDQRSLLRDRINDVRRSFNDARTNCRRDVSRLRTIQNKLEGGISRQFNQDLNVRFSN